MTVRQRGEDIYKFLSRMKNVRKEHDYINMFRDIIEQYKKLWQSHFDDYFTLRRSWGLATTGQLKNAIDGEYGEDGKAIRVNMYVNAVYRPGDWNHFNYANAQIDGTSPSRGAYSYELDRRVKFGTHPGVNNLNYYVPFKRNIDGRMEQWMDDKIDNVLYTIMEKGFK